MHYFKIDLQRLRDKKDNRKLFVEKIEEFQRYFINNLNEVGGTCYVLESNSSFYFSSTKFPFKRYKTCLF